MPLSRKIKLSALTLLCANLLASQVPVLAQEANDQASSSQERATVGQYSLAFDNAAWQYDEANDIYWQVGVVYVANPASLDYETLGIYVPGAYLEASDNVETNLALALENQANGAVKSVDFATVWEQGHTTAERTGHASTNFIQWVQEIVTQDAN